MANDCALKRPFDVKPDLSTDECNGTQGVCFATSMADIIDAVSENLRMITIFLEMFGKNLLLVIGKSKKTNQKQLELG